jgi:cobalamin biosynthesis Mg chelatase CobN
LVATAGTSNITIVGAKNIQRTTDFTTGGDLFANTLNDELDNQTIFIQQVAETAERALKAPVTDPTDIAMTLPSKSSRAGKVLSFDGTTGNPIASITASDVSNAQTYANNASASASAAASSASAASGSATSASNSATAAAASAAAAATKVAKTSDTGSAVIPAGTTGERDGSPANGYFRYNSSLASFEGYVGGAWGGVGGAQAGGVIFENSTTISANYTLSSSKNGLSVGPITVSSGATLTIPSGQRYVIL